MLSVISFIIHSPQDNTTTCKAPEFESASTAFQSTSSGSESTGPQIGSDGHGFEPIDSNSLNPAGCGFESFHNIDVVIPI